MPGLAAFLFIVLSIIVIVYIIKHTPTRPRYKQRDYDDADTHIEPHETSNIYAKKEYLMTRNEANFYDAIAPCLPNGYHLVPQVPLNAVVDKVDGSKYRNELFRIIDFGVFDEGWRIKFVIELNDESHNTYQRRSRDNKVKSILEAAGIPLITLWESYGVKPDYTKKRIDEELMTAYKV